MNHPATITLLCFVIFCIGCGNRSMTIINQADAPLQLEVAIGSEGYKLFSNTQNYRFRLAEGETWHSRHAHRDHRVRWPAADGVHTGILIRSREMLADQYEVYHVSYFNRRHATVILSGTWPRYELTAFDQRNETIEVALAAPDGREQE